ncbi:MAG: AMP-binding enzyme [Candidatus Rokuibacteriota bacterium]
MEVEAFLMSHPAVNLAAVVGLADARLAEVGVAFVRLEPEARATESELIDFCRGQIASFKIPRQVVIVADFPLTGSGKIQKVKLRAEAQQRFGSL